MQSRGGSPEPGERREKGKQLRQAGCCSSRRQDSSLLAGSEAARNYRPEIWHGEVLELKSQGEGPELKDCSVPSSLLVGRAGCVPPPQPLTAQHLLQIPAAQHGQGWRKVTRRGGKNIQKEEPRCQVLHIQHIGGQSTDRSLGCAGQSSPWVQEAPSCPRPAAPTPALLPARLRAPSQHCQLCQARAAPADVQARCCRRLLPLSSPCQKESIARPHVQMVQVDFPSAQPDAFTFGVLSRVTAPRGQEEQ